MNAPRPMASPDMRHRLAVIAAAATIALTAAAFWLSYQHLHDVAHAHGLAASPVRAWAWPATVDLFIVVGEVLILRASLEKRVDRWAIFLTAAGSGGSIALNVAGVGAGAGALNYVVAAVPPIAALLAFGALMRQYHGALAQRSEGATPEIATALPGRHDAAPQDATNDATTMPAERHATAPQGATEAPAADATERHESAPDGAATGEQPERHVTSPEAATEAATEGRAEQPQSAPKAPRKRPSKAPAKPRSDDPRTAARTAIRNLYDTLGRRPLESEMVAELVRVKSKHTSRQFANKVRSEIEKDEPALAALGSDNVRPLTGS